MGNNFEVYYKKPDQNTLGAARLKAISEGNRVEALTVQTGGIGHASADAAGVSQLALRGRRGVIEDGTLIDRMPAPVLRGNVGVRALMSGFDAPLPSFGGRSFNQVLRERRANGASSIIEEILAGRAASAEGNTLLPEWRSLWDAMRIDLTIRKMARPTVRELIYNVTDTPNATRVMTPTEMYPHGIIFEENNGQGQAVRQGEIMGGEYDSITQKIYAAALTVDLLLTLFGENYTESSVNEAVAIGESGLKDDLALAPIFAHSYVAAAQTAAHVDADATREELLYKTYQDAVDDLGVRRDPITQREIDATGLVLLTSPTDARRAASVLGGGFPASQGIGSYMSMEGAITRIIGYDPETIVANTETKTYTAVPTGKAYLIKPNRRMAIAIKRRLQLNVNMAPNPATLAQEEKAWWFCEAIYNAGISDWIQEVTLPAW